MRRTLRTLVVTSAVASLSMSTAGVVSAQQGGGAADEAFGQVAECVADTGRLSILSLVDESASLDTTDPQALRTTALEAVVRNLASVVASTGGDVSVDLKLAAFSSDYMAVSEWSALTPESLPATLDEVRGFANRDNGLDTDFAHAFEGARDAFDAVAGDDSCRVLLTFTDGEYDLEARSRTTRYAPDLPLNQGDNAERVEEIGRTAICDPDGIADDLHANDVVTVTVGLSPSIAAEDQDFLAAASEGRSGDCGSLDGDGLGAYVGADDLDGLLFAFDRASTGFVGGALAAEDEVVPCELEACPSGTTTFELDESLRQFHALVTAPAPLTVQLTAPGGETAMVDPRQDGSVGLAGADLSWVALAGALVIDGRLDAQDPGWVGEWQVTFIDPTGQAQDVLARAQVTIFGTLAPSFGDVADARIGEELSLAVAMVDAEGSPRTPRDLLASTDLDVTLRDPASGEEIKADVGPPDGQGRWTATAMIPSGFDGAGLEATATLVVTTVGGVALPAKRDTRLLSVLPPASFPRVEPAVVSFDPIEGHEPGTATLRIIGGEDPGCVWIALGEPDAGRDVGGVSLTAPTGTTPSSCVSVAPGEIRELPIQLSRDGSASGRLDHTMTVHLTSDASGDELQQQLGLRADFVRVVDQARRLSIFLVVFLLGLLIPLAFLYAVNRYTARFRDPMFVRYARTPVRVTEDDLQRLDRGDGHPFDIDARELKPVEADIGDQAHVDVDGVRLRPRVPLWPFSPPVGIASRPGSDVCATKGFRVARDGTTIGEINFALPSSWVFVRTEVGDGETTGDLFSFVNEGSPFDEIRDRHLAELRRSVPATVNSMPAPPTSEAGVPDEDTSTPAGWTPPETRATPEAGWRPPGGHSAPSPAREEQGTWTSSPPPPGARPSSTSEADDAPTWRPPPD